MPPKKGDKPKEKKPAVDKTFGMKNKKGGKGQAAIALAQQQAAQVGRNDEAKRKEKERLANQAKKDLEAARKAQAAELAKPIQMPQKVPFGSDPKTILCINFKAGYCERGAKCRFSHDPDVGRKVEKKDMYTDTRDEAKDKDDNMENWTEEKLREVIAKKMGTEDLPESNKGKNTNDRYDIVCKHFIDAIESNKYGWFWECPNGGTQCKYRHALPPGFVLKSQRKKDEEAEKAKEISMEEFLEVERHKLPKDKLTPVTKESFAKWKETRMNKKEAEQDALAKTKAAQASAGKAAGMSGRDLFTYNPLLLEENEYDSEGDDDDDWDMEKWRAKATEERDEAERKRMAILEGGMADTTLADTNGETNGA